MSVPARRRQVAYGRERGLSVRRACTLFSVARSALRYQGRKTAKDAGVIERMQELSAQYPRYGYRRIRIFLGRDGHRMSVGRAYRLWRAAISATFGSLLARTLSCNWVAAFMARLACSFPNCPPSACRDCRCTRVPSVALPCLGSRAPRLSHRQ